MYVISSRRDIYIYIRVEIAARRSSRNDGENGEKARAILGNLSRYRNVASWGGKGEGEGVESGERDPRDSPSQFGSEETHRLVSARNIYVAYIPHPRPVASKGDSAMRVARLSLAAATS